MRFRTRAVHLFQKPDPATGAVVPPLYLASTYAQHEAGEWREFDYARSGNPTRDALERTLADLEGGAKGLAVATGMAATHTALMLLKPGDHLVAGGDLYGGTYRMLKRVLAPLGIEATFAEADSHALAAACRPETKAIWLEALGNPLLGVPDLAAAAEVARRHGALLAVDSTFATPALCRPLEFGADLVMHSATKYFGGHSDLSGGILVAKDAALGQRLYSLQNACGNVLPPFDSYLVRRGVKTLELRMREHCRSAQRLAEWLAAHPKVVRVHYPGLATHPGHELAQRQMPNGCGGVLSFDLDADLPAAKSFVKATKLFALAVSMGAVESLISLPALMSHATYSAADRQAKGIGDSLVRLSVGLEDPADLIADLETAFAAL